MKTEAAGIWNTLLCTKCQGLKSTACRIDAEALLEHGHAGLRLIALVLRQTAFLLLLSILKELDHSLVVALHLFLFL
ncbi:hypothetical protein GOODEAATRI_005244 [Goodea atripinnis]|uniref:Uncharacterized protein n=1 Tax=Goodea atripinnis TaxID=208336 RepID=A0ABV0MF72_9TELE